MVPLRLILPLLALSSIVSKAYAWESFPEFESLTEQEESGFDQPLLLGPEYQSDVLAYSKPPEWEYDWLAHDVAFDTSIGSVSAVNFLTGILIQVKAELGKTFCKARGQNQ